MGRWCRERHRSCRQGGAAGRRRRAAGEGAAATRDYLHASLTMLAGFADIIYNRKN